MKNQRFPKRSRATLSALLVAAGLGVLHGASGCGRAESPSLDSETHWLMSCRSDGDCAAGSCECGVCTEPCSSDAECSALGVTGVECVAGSGACASGESAGASAAASSMCLLPCVDSADCGALGSGAVCEAQRCERPVRSLGDGAGGASNSGGGSGGSGVVGGGGGQPGTGGTGSASAAVLCDGSDDVRFVWITGGGAVDVYYGFAASRGHGFLVVDGQCRFWRASQAGGAVSSGTLSAADAASFASAIGYERLPELASYDDPEGCPDAGATRVWTPYGSVSCICGCDESNGGGPWLPALGVTADPRLDGWLASGAPVTGPAQLAFVSYPDGIGETDPLPWPLSRAPAENELYTVVVDPPLLDESSGVQITDPDELSALRAARDTYLLRNESAAYTPLELTVFDNPNQDWFHMLLRDELPPLIQAALERAQGR